ncbi:unnamed protein product, partial [Amoebophrya sp. A25]|eukprot:GSA25T00009017001.1
MRRAVDGSSGVVVVFCTPGVLFTFIHSFTHSECPPLSQHPVYKRGCYTFSSFERLVSPSWRVQ